MKFVFFVVFTAFYAALILKGSELVELTMPIILTIFLTLVIPIALILYFHKSSWDWLSDIVSKRIEALSSILTQQLLAMRDAIASQDKDTLVLIAKESSETFSKWYQLRISVNSIRRFGVIRSLFHLLFRPCQFYLK